MPMTGIQTGTNWKFMLQIGFSEFVIFLVPVRLGNRTYRTRGS